MYSTRQQNQLNQALHQRQAGARVRAIALADVEEQRRSFEQTITIWLGIALLSWAALALVLG